MLIVLIHQSLSQLYVFIIYNTRFKYKTNIQNVVELLTIKIKSIVLTKFIKKYYRTHKNN